MMRFRNAIGGVGVALFLTSCGDCTLVGCLDGLEVQLDQRPTTAFRVEATSPDAGDQAVECASPGTCGVFFNAYRPTIVTLRVIRGADTVTTANVRPVYERLRPNGAGCPGDCRYGRVTARAPR